MTDGLHGGSVTTASRPRSLGEAGTGELAYESLASAFRWHGTDVVFSLMGDGNMEWLSSLMSVHGVLNVHARSEGSAVAMADGFARARGEVSVASVTMGPGLTQAMTAIIGAARYRVPMVVFAGATVDPGYVQYLDQREFARLCGADFVEVDATNVVGDAVDDAFRRASAQRRPVILNVPLELQRRVVSAAVNSARRGGWRSDLRDPDEEQLDGAAGLLALARRPVFLVGAGALGPKVRQLVETLGDHVGAVYAETLLARGAMGGSPHSVGVAGTFSTEQAQAVLGRADLVLAIGASLNAKTTQNGALFRSARVIQIVDRREAAPALDVDCVVEGDAERVLEQLVDRVVPVVEQSAGMRSLVRGPDPLVGSDSLRPDPPDGVDPRNAADLLQRHLPERAIVAAGAGHFSSFTNKLAAKRGQRYLHCIGFGSIGQALPVGIGGACADRSRPAVVLEGDTSILYNVQELDTAVRLGLDLTVVVFDDEAMGAELHKLRLRGWSGDTALVPTPDLAAVAEGFGATGITCRTTLEFEQALTAHTWRGVALFRVCIARSVVDRDRYS